jgi:hypothetical protein
MFVERIFRHSFMSDEEALSEAFKSGKIFESTPEDQKRFLRALGHYNVNGDSFQIRALIRALIINHLQTAGVIRDLNTQNSLTSMRVTVLTRWCAILAGVQVAAAAFFIWRDFNPRDVAGDQKGVSRESHHDAQPDKDQGGVEPKPSSEN